MLSLVLELAFVMKCDSVEYNQGHPVMLGQLLHRYFEPPHVDWRGSGKVDRNNPEYKLLATLMKRHARFVPDSGVRVRTAPSAYARRLYMFNRARLAPMIGDLSHVPTHRMEGCLLRYLLAPSSRLKRLVSNLVQTDVKRGAGRGGGSGGNKHSGDSFTSLMPVVGMHVRLGDAAFFADRAAKRRAKAAGWLFTEEVRPHFFQKAPGRMFACLRRAAALTQGSEALANFGRRGGPANVTVGDGAAATKQAAHSSPLSPPRCLGCVVVSDSKAVDEYARKSLDAPLLTPGDGVQLVANQGDASMTAENVDKAFLDWWLLARAAGTLTFGPSAFATTAIRFRDATSAAGFRIHADNYTEMLSPGWVRICDGTRRASLPLPPCSSVHHRQQVYQPIKSCRGRRPDQYD